MGAASISRLTPPYAFDLTLFGLHAFYDSYDSTGRIRCIFTSAKTRGEVDRNRGLANAVVVRNIARVQYLGTYFPYKFFIGHAPKYWTFTMGL